MFNRVNDGVSMEIISFILFALCIFGVYTWTYNRCQKGADEMYTHLYNQGVRKDDHVIVKLEYEDRSSIKEF